MTNHVDRFHAAVSVLAGNGRVKQRLTKAYGEYLADIEANELPATVKQDFADLKSVMFRVDPLNGEGAVCASVRKMSVREAGEYARSVVSLYREILRLEGRQPIAPPVDQADTDPVPPFLVKSN